MPPEVELVGLDVVEFGMDFYPEYGSAPESIIDTDGLSKDAGPILTDAYHELVKK